MAIHSSPIPSSAFRQLLAVQLQANHVTHLNLLSFHGRSPLESLTLCFENYPLSLSRDCGQVPLEPGRSRISVSPGRLLRAFLVGQCQRLSPRDSEAPTPVPLPTESDA